MYGYNKEELSFRKLDFGVGIRRESWKNNVIAIGLSSFFLEPIESTAISTMHHQISTVYNMLMHDYILPKDKIKRFNEIIEPSKIFFSLRRTRIIQFLYIFPSVTRPPTTMPFFPEENTCLISK